jgi:hypothetical protein
LDGGILLSALPAVFAIALITVGYKPMRAALANPMEALRYEESVFSHLLITEH